MSAEGAASATRDLLLDAAKRVVRHAGAGHLTLDAVAKEAGVSKGGLLYHFPSKQALLRGMVAKGISHVEEEIMQELGPKPGQGDFARCFLRHSMLEEKDCEEKPPVEMIWSMIGAAANDPPLLEPIQEMHATWQHRLEQDIADNDVATLIRLTTHGLWSTEVFGFNVPDLTQRGRILTLLSKLAGLDQAAPSGSNEREKEEKR